MESSDVAIGFMKSYKQGFSIDFPNGWTASIQWSYKNLCANQKKLLNRPRPNQMLEVIQGYEDRASGCWNAEVGAFPTAHIEQEWYKFSDGDDVKGYQYVMDVLEFLNVVSKLHPPYADCQILCCEECEERVKQTKETNGTISTDEWNHYTKSEGE